MKTTGLKRVNTFIVAAISLALVLIAGVSAVFFQRRAVELARDATYELLGNEAAGKAGELVAVMDGKWELLEAVAGTIDVYSGREEAISRMNAAVQAWGFTRLIYSDAAGAAYSSDGSDLNISDRGYFAHSLEGERAIEKIPGNRVTGSEGMAMSVPVYAGGSVAGVLVGCFDGDLFAMTLSDGGEGEGYTLICDASGEIIAAADSKNYLGLDGTNILAMLRRTDMQYGATVAQVAEDFARGNQGVLTYEYSGQTRSAVYSELPVNDWRVFAVVTDSTADREASQLARVGYTMVGVIIIAALGLMYFIVFNQRRYRQQLELYRSMEAGGAFTMALDEGLTLVYGNDRFYQILGYTKQELREKTGDHCARVIHPADLDEVRARMSAVLEAGGAYASWDMRVIDGTGKLKYLMMSGVVEKKGGNGSISGVAVDITEQKRGEQQLARMYRRELNYRKAMEPNFYASAMYNITRRTQVDVRSCDVLSQERFRDVSFEEFARLSAEQAEGDEAAKSYFTSLSIEALEQRANKTADPVAFDYRRSSPDGGERWMHYESHLLREPDTGDLMAFFYLTDITEQKKLVLELETAARTDSMTGLLNHDATMREMTRFLSMEGIVGDHALFMIDLDNFKHVNDTLGHQTGDKVLIVTAETVKKTFRSTDIIGRVGGDEFLVLMKGAASDALIRRKAQELLESLSRSLPAGDDGEQVEISGSVGVVVCKDANKTFEALYAEADAALYKAKNAGKNNYCLSGGEVADAAAGDGLTHSAVSLRMLLEHIDGGIVLAEVADDIKVTYVSPSFMNSFNRSRADVGESFEHIWELVAPEEREGVRASIRRAVETDEVVDHVYRVLETDCSVGWRHLRAVRLPEEGEVPRVIGVITDVTELKEREEKS